VYPGWKDSNFSPKEGSSMTTVKRRMTSQKFLPHESHKGTEPNLFLYLRGILIEVMKK